MAPKLLKFILLISIIILFNSLLIYSMNLPGYDLEVESVSDSFSVMSHQQSIKNNREFVYLKEPSQVNSWSEKVKSYNSSEVNHLRRRTFNYLIEKLEYSEVKNKFPEENFFSAELDSSERNMLNSLNIVKKIEPVPKAKIAIDETTDLTKASTAWDWGFTGEDVGVCVLDTGVDYTHSHLGGCDELYSINKTNVNTNKFFLSEKGDEESSNEKKFTKINESGSKYLSLNFKNINLSSNDYLSIYDSEGNEELLIEDIDSFSNYSTGNISLDYLEIYIGSDDFENYNQSLKLSSYTYYNYYESCDKILGGWNFADGNNNPIDKDGHGTHVSGIVSAKGSEYYGIAPESHIIPVKVLDDEGKGNFGDIKKGIDYCVEKSEKYNIKVISMSLGSDSTFESEEDCNDFYLSSSINNAKENGIIVTAASGNDESDTSLVSPACLPSVLSVGSVDKSNKIAESNRNKYLDTMAYGHRILSTFPENSFVTSSGTSMATPHVAGALALYYEYTNEYDLNYDFDSFLNDFSRTNNTVEENDIEYPILDIKTLLALENYNFSLETDQKSFGPYSDLLLSGYIYPETDLKITLRDNQSNYWNSSKWVSNQQNLSLDTNENLWKYNMSDIKFESGEKYSFQIYDRYDEILLNHSFMYYNSSIEFNFNQYINNSVYSVDDFPNSFYGNFSNKTELDSFYLKLISPNNYYWNGSDFIKSKYYLKPNVSENNWSINFKNTSSFESGSYNLIFYLNDSINYVKKGNFSFGINNFDILYLSSGNINLNDYFCGNIENWEINNENFSINETGYLIVKENLSVGDYSLNFSYSGDYCDTDKEKLNISINKIEPTVNLNSSLGWYFNYSNKETIINFSHNNPGSSDVDFKLWRDGEYVGVEDNIKDVGNYQYILNTSGGENYSSSSILVSNELKILTSKPKINLSLKNFSNGEYVNFGDSFLIKSNLSKGEFGYFDLLIDYNNSYNSDKLVQSNPTNISYNYTFNNTLGNLSIISRFYNSSNYKSKNVSLNLSVLDKEAPKFKNIPESFNLTYGGDFPEINFNATDNVEIDEFSVNDSERFLISDKGKLTNKTKLDVDNYSLNISVNDSSGNKNSTIFNFKITKSQSNVELTIYNNSKNYSYGSKINLSGNIIKGDISSMELLLFDTSLSNFNNSNFNYSLNLTNVGKKNLTLFYSGSNNFYSSNDTKTIEVIDEKPPRVNDVSVNLPTIYNKSNNYSFEIKLYDPNGINKSKLFLKNHSSNEFKSFNLYRENNVFNYSLSNLSYGNYSYYFWAEDSKGNSGKITSISNFNILKNLSEGEDIINHSKYKVSNQTSSLFYTDLSKIKMINTSNNKVRFNILNNLVNNELYLKNEMIMNHKDNHSIFFPENLTLTFNDHFDGNFYLPYSDKDFEHQGKKIGENIFIGSNLSGVQFDKPVRINLSGESEKNVALKNNNSKVVNINKSCKDINDPSNINYKTNKTCFFDDGNDLILWTYRFSTFFSYNEVIDGKCSDKDGLQYGYDVDEWDENDFCDSGELDPVYPSFPDKGDSVTWECIGEYGGETSKCSVSREKEPESDEESDDVSDDGESDLGSSSVPDESELYEESDDGNEDEDDELEYYSSPIRSDIRTTSLVKGKNSLEMLDDFIIQKVEFNSSSNIDDFYFELHEFKEKPLKIIDYESNNKSKYNSPFYFHLTSNYSDYIKSGINIKLKLDIDNKENNFNVYLKEFSEDNMMDKYKMDYLFKDDHYIYFHESLPHFGYYQIILKEKDVTDSKKDKIYDNRIKIFQNTTSSNINHSGVIYDEMVDMYENDNFDSRSILSRRVFDIIFLILLIFIYLMLYKIYKLKTEDTDQFYINTDENQGFYPENIELTELSDESELN